MSVLSLRHLQWVLWLSLLIGGGLGEEGAEGRALKGGDGPSYPPVPSNSTLQETKPPDDRQSTISRLRNETVDLSRNTVPVLPGSGKYRRTTTAIPSFKAAKLKRTQAAPGDVTKPRPADLTTLLAFNALGPREQQLLPSSTQLTEAIPPTAWALASLRGPTSKSTPGLRPYVHWSTRISRPTTTSQTGITESVTNNAETTDEPELPSDITGEGEDLTSTPSVSETVSEVFSSSSEVADYKLNAQAEIKETTLPSIKLKNSTQEEHSVPELTRNESNIVDIDSKEPSRYDSKGKSTAKNETAPDKSTLSEKSSSESVHTLHEESEDRGNEIVGNKKPINKIIPYKTEENTISAPSLSSLKNSSLSNNFIAKKDISDSAHLVSSSGKDFAVESGYESSLETDSIYPTKFNITEEKITSTSTPLNETGKDSSSINQMNSTSESSNLFENTTSSIGMSDGPENSSPFNTLGQLMGVTNRNDIPQNAKLSTEASQELVSETTLKKYDLPSKGPIQEADPSNNVINEKKNDEGLSTSTVISTVNSTVTMHISSPSTTPRTANHTVSITEAAKIENQIEIEKNPPVVNTTTTAKGDSTNNTIISISSQKEKDKSINNQTIINDIKPILIPLDNESLQKATTKSNDIKPEIFKNEPQANKPTNEFVPDIPETTQSNYIQVHEIIKPQNKTVPPHLDIPEEVTSKPSTTTPVPIMTMKTTLSTEVPQLLNLSTTESVVSATDFDSLNVSRVAPSVTTVTTPIPVTTTPPSTTTISPTLGYTNPPPEPSSTPSTSTTTKSNNIKDQEATIGDHSVIIPEKNMTQYEYESPNTVKNESTPVIIQEPDEVDEEESTINQTDFADKHHPSDHIPNGEDQSEEHVSEDSGAIGTVSAEKNDTKAINIIPSITKEPSTSSKGSSQPTTKTTSQPSTTKITSRPTSTTTNIDENIPTHIDEDPSGMDEDTMYDTGVMLTVNIRLIFEATYSEMCREKDHLRDAIVRSFKRNAERKLEKRQVQLFNMSPRECAVLRGTEIDQQRQTAVLLCITDQQGQYDKVLNDILLSLARQNQLDFKYPITQIEKVIPQPELTLDLDSQPSGTIVAAIIISSIAGVCLLVLTILLMIMRKRQSGFNYGQRCTPVSLDDYSLDNISVYNSVRRKALRASKRSYGNPAFDDPDVLTNPVNFAGLANMASNKSKTDEEFSNLPTVVVRPDELPPGAENKNRYANVVPLPETRVHLEGNTPEEQFINANYVRGVKEADKFYIACQAPMQNTVDDFWKMVWDEQSRLIIMLTALTENGVEKCADYLPVSEVLDCHRLFGNLQVTLKKREAREKYVISSLQLKNLETNLWREVTHMWYAGWPPTGVPLEPSSVIAFLIEARSYGKASPIVVHCSPGTGRTGTVIAIDIAIRDFEAGRSVDIPKTVIQVRRGRAGAVQTKDQYHFIYKVLHLYATKLTGGGLDSI